MCRLRKSSCGARFRGRLIRRVDRLLLAASGRLVALKDVVEETGLVLVLSRLGMQLPSRGGSPLKMICGSVDVARVTHEDLGIGEFGYSGRNANHLPWRERQSRFRQTRGDAQMQREQLTSLGAGALLSDGETCVGKAADLT